MLRLGWAWLKDFIQSEGAIIFVILLVLFLTGIVH